MTAWNKSASSFSRARTARALRWRSACLLSLLACGCNLAHWSHNDLKVGPDYCDPPPVWVADEWIDGEDSRVDSAAPLQLDWWSVFEDPVLNYLIEMAYDQNLTLREAGWRVMQARARRRITAGNLFPQQQQAFGDFARIQESRNVALPPPLRAFDDWSTGFSLSWELDVWGRFRRAVASADANVEVAVGDYDAILVCLIAEVARAYTDYRTFEKRLEYARRNVEIQEGSLQLTQEKADAGSTGYTSVHLAKSSLESTRAGIPNLETGLRQANNRLCTLLGVPPSDLQELLDEGGIPSAPAEVAVGIPAELLRRRPDIRAAERAVAAQSEQIGIAISDLYPHFSINGEFSLESENLSDLFASGSGAGIINPAFRWDLLNYGRIINNVRLQGFGLEELITSYQNKVLTANQEVEDALVAFLNNQQRLRHLQATEAETQEALRLLTLSFEEGEISFTGVFVLQGALVAQQDQLAQAQGDISVSLIGLYKALGGGWEVPYYGFQEGVEIVEPGDDAELVPTPEPTSFEQDTEDAAAAHPADVELQAPADLSVDEATADQ